MHIIEQILKKNTQQYAFIKLTMESQGGFGWKGPKRSSGSSPLP